MGMRRQLWMFGKGKSANSPPETSLIVSLLRSYKLCIPMESRQKKRPRISMTDQGLLQGISHALIENPTEEMLSEEYGVDLDSEEDSNNVCSFNKGQSSGVINVDEERTILNTCMTDVSVDNTVLATKHPVDLNPGSSASTSQKPRRSRRLLHQQTIKELPITDVPSLQNEPPVDLNPGSSASSSQKPRRSRRLLHQQTIKESPITDVPSLQNEPPFNLNLGSSASSSQKPYRSRRVVQQQTIKESTITDVPSLQNDETYLEPLTSAAASAQTPRRKRSQIYKACGYNHVQTSPFTLPEPTYCEKCNAKKFAYESNGFCCANGTIKLATNEFPADLQHLFTCGDETGEHFRTYSRIYNNLFAFSSIGGIINAKTYKGIYVFQLQGQMYHFVPDLLPADDKPNYLQLYFYDAQHERENRLGLFDGLRDDIISTLMRVMSENPYARFFKSLGETNVVENTKITLNKNPSVDQRTENAPTADEVAAIWSDSTGSSTYSSPHIIVSGKSGESHRIYHHYGCYDPLQYPLLCPKGECGWRQGIPKVPKNSSTSVEACEDRLAPQLVGDPEELFSAEASVAAKGQGKGCKNISCREYYAYKLQIRPSNFLLRGCRLLQQFLVDMYVKIENTRLDYFRNNQMHIRAELYQGILDSVFIGEHDARNVGHRIVLPPSFIGGPRDMKRRYLNAMALVQKHGKPDLFVTLTCNPNWPEITDELAHREKGQNRADLIARVFKAKLVKVKEEILKKHAFGEVAAMIDVVEFQKRGLPHAHILIILEPKNKIRCVEQFDQFVCAELPLETDSHLRKIVLRHMMHGPCGALNPKCPCMKKINGVSKCQYGYPHRLSRHTSVNGDGYPEYRRRDTGAVQVVRGVAMDNTWVVPYNPYLLSMFDCHMNVEVCSTISAVKYLYKYVYKGHDRISFQVEESDKSKEVDEIKRFQSGRWVSPPEAAWRIFSFDLYNMYPSVQLLQVHLPDKQSVCFWPNEKLLAVAANEKRRRTSLSEYFSMNRRKPDGPEFLYAEFPEHYVWNQDDKIWTKRTKGKTIGRLAFASPSEGERYYLRLLLTSVRGAKSFDDLRTVNGKKCPTYKEAAIQRGILEDSDFIELCLDEVVEVHMAQALRRLFATILIFCQPADPPALWNKYYDYLSEDFRFQYPHNANAVKNFTCQKVEQLLESMGKSFRDYNLGFLNTVEYFSIRRTKDIQDALDAPVPEEYLKAAEKLNKEQREAYDCIVQRIIEGKHGAFFIDGPGGTGKTFLYQALYAKVRTMNKIVLPTATSGIAASNIVTGRTAHSRFRIPLDCNNYTCNVGKQTSLAQLIRQSALIIWDEAGMARRENVEALDMLLRDLCDGTTIFGGKVIVFGGDFRQVLPVVPKKTQEEVVEYSLVSSHLWPFFEKFRLIENMRAREDPVYTQFLLSLGDGKLQTKQCESVSLPPEIMLPSDDNIDSLHCLIDKVFPDLTEPCFNTDLFNDHAVLTTKNSEVDMINSMLMDKFHGKEFVYTSFDQAIDDNNCICTIEFLNSLCPAGMSPHKLVLKLNCPVMLLRNIDPSHGLCNGTRLICKRFYKHNILCEVASGYNKGEVVFIHRIILRPSESSMFPFNFERKQFPIKPSFAMTINKSQGQTLQEVGVYLREPCFAHGQLYVALSRARKASGVTIYSNPSSEEISTSNTATNVVCFEILRRADIQVG